jgi:hypothetical protein
MHYLVLLHHDNRFLLLRMSRTAGGRTREMTPEGLDSGYTISELLIQVSKKT